jgi:hypothetical protein
MKYFQNGSISNLTKKLLKGIKSSNLTSLDSSASTQRKAGFHCKLLTVLLSDGNADDLFGVIQGEITGLEQ